MYDAVITGFTIVLISLCLCSSIKAVQVFGGLTALYNLVSMFLPDVSGLAYYLGAAFNDLIIITVLSKSENKNHLITTLQIASSVFIVINLIGWIMYEAMYSPTVYFVLSSITYLYIIYMIAKYGEFSNVGNNRISSRMPWISSNNFKRSINIQKQKG